MFTLVGASVDIPYKVYKVLGDLGPKLYFLRLPKEYRSEDERLKQSREDFSEKQKRIQSALFAYLKWLEIRSDMQVEKESSVSKIQWDFPKDDETAERYIEQTGTNTAENKTTILIVDRPLVIELKDDYKEVFEEAIGFSIYSNSQTAVSSYVAIFNNLWVQTELYQQTNRS